MNHGSSSLFLKAIEVTNDPGKGNCAVVHAVQAESVKDISSRNGREEKEFGVCEDEKNC